MSRQQMLQVIIIDAAKGDLIPLLGLLDHCQDKGYSLYRITRFATKRLKIPFSVVQRTLKDIYGTYLLRVS